MILGANGAGKTTTLRALSGMIHARGSIRFAGESIIGAKPEQIAACRHRARPTGPGDDSPT